MRHNVEDTGHHLILRKGVRIFGVQYGKSRAHLFAKVSADLALLSRIGNNRIAVHFRTRTDHGQYTTDGHNILGRLFTTCKEFFPRIAFRMNGYGYGLSIIDNRTAADGKQ